MLLRFAEHRIVTPLPWCTPSHGCERDEDGDQQRIAAGPRNRLVKGVIQALVIAPVLRLAGGDCELPQLLQVVVGCRLGGGRCQCRFVDKPRLDEIGGRCILENAIDRPVDTRGCGAEESPLALMAPEQAFGLKDAQRSPDCLAAASDKASHLTFGPYPVLRSELLLLEMCAQAFRGLGHGHSLGCLQIRIQTNL